MIRSSLALVGWALCGCYHPPFTIAPAQTGEWTARAVVRLDTAPKEEPRLVPPEAYVRTYLQLFGGLAPLDAQKVARGGDGNKIFDSWYDYVASLGFPDYRLDLPRATQTNALMVATFERIGDALCDRAVERDWKQKPALAKNQRVVFAFDPTPRPPDEAEFARGFDVLHRTFLGYPAPLAGPDRTLRFYRLFQATVVRHTQTGAPKSRFSPVETGWATVCYGLVRHPEFHFY